MNTALSSSLLAMFWKECRELSKWAVFGAIALCIALVYVIGTKSVASDYAHWPNVSYANFWSRLSVVMTIGAPVIAFVIAMAQILPELRRDQWAFLVHRPASRSVLFWGKVGAGLSLSMLASTLPFLLAVLWAKTPGNLAAPFDWRLALGGAAIILNSSVFYFAGLIVALRPAQWYGSRAIPLVTALGAAMYVGTCQEFWQAFLAITFAAIVLGTAAHGSFSTIGQYTPQTKTAKAALGLTLTMGLTLTLLCVTALVVNFIDHVFVKHHMELPNSSYRITTSGQIVRLAYRTPDVYTVTDLQGKTADLPRDQNGNQYLLQYEFYNSQSFGPLSSESATYASSERYAALEAVTKDNLWFYAFGQDRLVGYSRDTHQFLGYLTPMGFTLPTIKSIDNLGTFPGPVLTNPYANFNRYEDASNRDTSSMLLFPNAVFDIDYAKHTVKPVLTTPSSERLLGINTPILKITTSMTAVLTQQSIELFGSDDIKLLTIPRTENADVYKSIAFTRTEQEDKYFVWYSHADDSIYTSRMPSIIVEYSKQGKLVNRTVLPALSSSRPQQANLGSWFGGLTPPILPVIAGAYASVPSQNGSLAFQIRHEFARAKALYIRFVALSFISGFFYAWSAFVISRRCAFDSRGQWGWTIGVFGLGLPGVLLMLSLFDWPLREICPTCHKKRVVNRTNCEHCGSEFSQPAHDGTEIFEEMNMNALSQTNFMEGIR